MTTLEGCKDAKFNRTEDDISERESIELNTQFILLIAHLGDGVIINLGYLMFWPSQSRLASLQNFSKTVVNSPSYVNYLLNKYKVWDLTRKDIVISRDVVFIEGKPIEQTPAVYVEEPRITNSPGPLAEAEEPKIIHDSITVLPGPPEPELVDPQILLQEYTRMDEQQDLAIGREVPGYRLSKTCIHIRVTDYSRVILD